MTIQFLASALGTRNVQFDQTFNFVTDFGGSTVGTNISAIAAMNTACASAVGRTQVVFPAGTYTLGTGINGRLLASGGDHTTFELAGVTFTNHLYFGTQGTYNDNTHHARVNTVSAGASSVTVKTEAHASRFTEGQYALMSGLDLQGFGYPINPQYHEYVLIADITGSVITFSAPLRYGYLDTWPNYATGSAFETDQGGPATLYALHPSWDQEIVVNGGTFADTVDQSHAKVRQIEWNGCTWPDGVPGPAPSEHKYARFYNCDFGNAVIEPDKICDRLIFDTVTANNLFFQSASVTDVDIINCTLTSLNGLGKGDCLVSGGTIGSFIPSPASYGVATGTLTLEDAAITTLNSTGTGGSTNNLSIYTQAGDGVLTIAKSGIGPQYWAVPGKRCALTGTNGQILQFEVVSLTEDGTNTIIATTLPDPIPDPWGGARSIAAIAREEVYASNCTGSHEIVNLCHPGAQGLPFFSYQKRTYLNNFGATADAFRLIGDLAELSINVTLAYVGAVATVNFTLGQFHVWGVNAAGTSVDYFPKFNAKAGGERVITSGGVMGTQTGDSNLSLGATWLSGLMDPWLQTASTGSTVDIGAGTLTIEIEMLTDQGIS